MDSTFRIRAIRCEDHYEAIGVTSLSSPALGSGEMSLRASFRTLDLVDRLLSEGKRIIVPLETPYPEIRPDDIIVETGDDLETRKRIAMNEIYLRTGQNAMEFNVLDSMDYLDSYMKLLAAGIFICDDNREDKYFEIIQKAQSLEDPGELRDGATFEEEQEYIDRKKEYDSAQANLKTLEIYLNSYDKMKKLVYVRNILIEANNGIVSAKTVEEIEAAVAKYREETKKYYEEKIVKV